MEGPSPRKQQARYPPAEQYALSGTVYALVAQSEQQGLEMMMDDQEMFSQANRINQLDAQYADMARQASPNVIEFTDPFAEFTNVDGL